MKIVRTGNAITQANTRGATKRRTDDTPSIAAEFPQARVARLDRDKAVQPSIDRLSAREARPRQFNR